MKRPTKPTSATYKLLLEESTSENEISLTDFMGEVEEFAEKHGLKLWEDITIVTSPIEIKDSYSGHEYDDHSDIVLQARETTPIFQKRREQYKKDKIKYIQDMEKYKAWDVDNEKTKALTAKSRRLQQIKEEAYQLEKEKEKLLREEK